MKDDCSQVAQLVQNLLEIRIEAHHHFLAKIRNSLESNKNCLHSKATTAKEKQLTHGLNSMRNDLESVIAAKSAKVVTGTLSIYTITKEKEDKETA